MFAFKKFVIHQDHCAMKVGTDGVLLGSWANGGKRILDIGTGTGLIALMMAQRYTDAIIDAVEIDHDAALQAYENVSNTEFANRIKIVETAIQHYSTQDKYNAIVSNPPFFIDSLLNPNAQRSTARTCLHAEILRVVRYRESIARYRRRVQCHHTNRMSTSIHCRGIQGRTCHVAPMRRAHHSTQTAQTPPCSIPPRRPQMRERNGRSMPTRY